MKYLLVDGNNLAVRAAFANDGLTNEDGVPTGVHFGVFQSLIFLKKKFIDHQFLIVWDGKSERRMRESKEGVSKKIITSAYKENRDKGDAMPQPLKDFYSQAPFLQKGIGQTGIPQIRLSNYEADDVIASYSQILKNEKSNDVWVVTSDKDYWQILDDNVSLWDGMKREETTKTSWMKEYGMEPSKAIDIGALCGDDGDNIFGVPSIGIKTAVKEVQKYGSLEGILQAYHKKYDALREKYPDLHKMDDVKLGTDRFAEMASVKSDPLKPTSRLKFPEIYFGMPFTGFCWEFYKDEIKIPKTELMALMFEERVRLAYSLKKMDDNIPDLPSFENSQFNRKFVEEYLEYFNIYSLYDDLELFECKNKNV